MSEADYVYHVTTNQGGAGMSDHTTYITIQTSKLTPQLTMLEMLARSGQYHPIPPDTIAPGSVVNYQLRDSFGSGGTEGLEMYYTDTGERWPLSLIYKCRDGDRNVGLVNGGNAE